jgi:glycosyltransferase involved in cell wall biosynthesis
MGISLITTVRNEEETIEKLLYSVSTQTIKPDEIVIVDGFSTDRTVELIESFDRLPIRLIQERSNIARGRNVAIANARNKIIAVTDGGCVLDSGWLEQITAPFENSADVVAGNYRAHVESLFDAYQCSFMNMFKSGDGLDAIAISSRSLAFRKSVWENLGGYPEWLNFSEDTYFHEQFFRRGYRVAFAPGATVTWTLRKDVKSLFRQFFLYMEGDGIAGLHPGRHAVRFLSYALGSVLLWRGVTKKPAFLPFLLAASGFYLAEPLSKFRRLNRYPLLGRPLVDLPLLLLLVDGAKMAGYLSGFLKRIREGSENRVTRKQDGSSLVPEAPSSAPTDLPVVGSRAKEADWPRRTT